MIIQSCPRCGSSRIRRGYRPTPWWQAILGRYNLLCNSCNWEFVGLAIPGTVPENVRKRKKQPDGKKQFRQEANLNDTSLVAETEVLSENVSLNDSNQQNLQDIVGNLSASKKHVQLISDPDNNNESLLASPQIDVIDETAFDIDQTPKAAKIADAYSNESDDVKLQTIAEKKTQRAAKSKIRKRVKGKQ